MEFSLGPEIITSYKRLSYTIWYALAEFVDNSTQSYFDNRQLLDEVYNKEGKQLDVKISNGVDDEGAYIRIEDNSIGMSYDELQNAVILGLPPKNRTGRSKYGLGLKTAACWFGDEWTIRTKKYNEREEHSIFVDVEKIAKDQRDLRHQSAKVDKELHYTVITIRKLHRNIQKRTITKIKNYLKSIYRIDLTNNALRLYWQEELLVWDYDEMIYSKLIKTQTGQPTKREFEFKVNNKNVRGWCGVYDAGGRSVAGFSIIQSDRVIVGWPQAYKPVLIFGDQEGGRNDLINQRIVGELFLDEFDVSHTKDEILFAEDEEEILENELVSKIEDFIQLARSHRKSITNNADNFIDAALNIIEKEIESDELRFNVFQKPVPPIEMIAESNRIIGEEVIKKNLNPSLSVTIDNLEIKLYIQSDISINDPYLIIRPEKDKNKLSIIINKSHPHWGDLGNSDSVLNFLRHCTYDGVAEWKAASLGRSLEPDSIKKIKDDLLRIPFDMRNHTN